MAEERLKGGYRAQDFADILMSDWQTGVPKGLSTGFKSLDEIYTIKRKQWTVVTGTPGSGKSTFVDNLMVSLAHTHGWKFLVCSPENQPIERHIETLAEIEAGKKYINPEIDNFPPFCMTADEMAKAVAFIDEHFYFICPDETDFNIDYILALASEIKHGFFNFDGFVLDPYNELEHKRPPGFAETEYISSLLSKVRRFVRAEDVHQWFVAHPTKQQAVALPLESKADLAKRKFYQRTSLYDIAGGAHWYNKTDNGIVVYRKDYDGQETTLIAVDKVRFKECGRKGEVEFLFERVSNRLVEAHV